MYNLYSFGNKTQSTIAKLIVIFSIKINCTKRGRIKINTIFDTN
jgi:hypothetical protein